MNQKQAMLNYASYAQNIKIDTLICQFDRPGTKQVVFGDGQRGKISFGSCTFHSKTMMASDGTYKVWVYYSPGEILQDEFEVKEPTSEEVLRVMLERATRFDANDSKVEIAA